MRLQARSIAILLLLIAAACGELKTPTSPIGGGPPPDPSATFTRVQNEVFTPSCATLACHDPLGQQSQMVLTAGRSYASIVGVASVEMPSVLRVAPNDPSGSYLYRKIVGSGITGDRMPLNQPPLSEQQTALVRDWIRRGAPND
ncbi:MAG: hypothetical protein M3P06_24790 [Acidobacteriota bacterium]|nr:hypothetical protein [Acidobacteriota bacterium]